MRIHVDEQADALYLRLSESTVVESEEVQPGVVLDFDEDGRGVGIEILRMKELVPQSDLKRIQVEFA
jgi:uncharacterized protein YuzE